MGLSQQLLSKGMSASAVGSLLNIDSKRVFRVLTRYVAHALCTQDIKSVSELAVDAIRKSEHKQYSELKSSRYLWLRNHTTLSDKQKEVVIRHSQLCPNTGKAYRLKELLRLVMNEAYMYRKITPLNQWIKEAWASDLEPIKKFVNMLRKHWYGVKNYFYSLSTNAYAERIKLKIQEIKRNAKGYRNTFNFIIMIYFHLGGLNLQPTKYD